MMIVNFKAYKQGREVARLVQLIRRYDENAIVCLGQSDLYLAKDVKLEVFAQHVDYESEGTGFLIPEALKGEGVKGSLLNHSEHKVSLDVIKKTLKRCKDLDLKVIVCVSSLKEVEAIKRLKPYAIAFEEPKLIGTGRSITKYGSDVVVKFVGMLNGSGIVPICGAGISTSDDYAEALGLGCKGVLISSVIAKVMNPAKFLGSVKRW